MDISHLLVSNSTQLDNVDLMSGPRDFTIADVTETGNNDQPLSIALAEYDRPWKPGLTMRRLMSELYGGETDEWIGKCVRLFRDDKVTFGKSKPGGTRISHASHMDKKVTVTLPISKGKFDEFTVEPLPTRIAPVAEPTPEQVAACNDRDILGGMWQACRPEMRAVIVARVAELDAEVNA